MAATGRLSGLTAIVTAAGQGLGEAIAKTFAREGAGVAVVDINLPEAQRVGAEIEAAGGAALVLQADVTRSQEVAAMVKAVVDRWETVDILVNGAGGFDRLAPITDISEEEWDRVINLNLKTAFLCTKAVAGIMIEKKKGRIISIASGAGVGPNPYAPSYLPYGAGKAGLIGFTKLLARDIGVYGITANTISPGTTLTPRVRKVRDAASIEKIKAQNPMRCLVEPEDTAEAALFLASDAACHITGINMNVNAGNLIV
ncbi:MAG: SDR family oxidoreductase [Betaproteobacteria bacterium]|nr:SDR family oxidoreductase [Betaproteobacteria bacterium]MBI3053878.1 SDR family oxidoreductase [Betaproteobacteria bacterium]